MSSSRVLIVTSAHWPGDARLNRHVTYLGVAGAEAKIVSFDDRPRLGAVAAALAAVARAPTDVVILPDPELFFPASLIARLRGIRAVIDIHEDYPAVASTRSWVPAPLRPIVSWLAGAAVWLGRLLASTVVVAAPELARPGDTLVSNVPDPIRMETVAATSEARGQAAYIGDLTEQRGALEMVEAIAAAGEPISLLLIGHASPQTAAAITRAASSLGVADRVELRPRTPHAEAWGRAAGALAGLNLLRPLPAYRTAVATKLWEYMAAGIPPIVTDLPAQAALVGQLDRRLVCAGPEEVGAALRLLMGDPALRSSIADKARQMAQSAWEESRPDQALRAAVIPDR